MNWGSAAEFFAMGGYGLYVGGSFGVTFAALLIETQLARKRFADTRRLLRRELAADREALTEHAGRRP